MPAIHLNDLVFRANGATILNGLEAQIPSGGVTAIIGPNGAGKSVTLRLLDGLLAPTRGEIRIAGPLPIRSAFVFQRTALVRASAAANVALALAPLKLSWGESAARIAAALSWAGLSERANDPATKFSGGEQQRLALARAWAVEPDLLLLDEPTASLDPATTERVENMIREMAARGVKVLLVSHNLVQVLRLADDVLVLAHGRAVEHGQTRAILFSPRTPQAQAYLAGELPWTHFAAAS